ncbi:preprotein translocase subunit SecY [Candidatus Saccharibacteria bacterium]|nr:preprotein translocase subunit SecY [Candidatus Saccharibacteria bacterium]MBR2864118.1 preprotein translocase subunit SecY [Candidatus Saccharibacteria bacterium]MBR3233276.1 preprotein translocase subunit SecY [Candidatus Saccharibacteria bacterium]
MHFKTIFKSFLNKDMRKRILIVLGILVAYRILAHVPVPLGDAGTFKEAIENLVSKSDFSSFLNLISGGGLTSFSIILVGLSPFITASIVVQLVTKAVPKLEELSQDGETGRRKINQWTRRLTVPLAIVQSIAYIFILRESALANTTTDITMSSGQWFLAITAMTAGSIILMWLGELITEQGIGNGISMIIFASIISQLPTTMASLGSSLFDTSSGSLSLFGWFNLPVNPTVFWIILGFAVALVVVIYFLVKINEAQRIITINYAKRVHGNSSYGGIKSILPIKLIAAGVVPVIFATSFLALPSLIGQLIQSFDPGNQFGQGLVTLFTAPSASNFSTLYPDGITAQWFLYPAMYFVLVVLFTYFYTSIIFNTNEIADNLQKQGGFIEGVRPGITTATYLGKVVNRLNLFGAFALGLIAMLPFVTDYIFIMTMGYPIGLSISGTGLLIVVTVALESLRQLDSRALMITYDEYK